MKWLLARIGLPKAIGLYIDEDTITLSHVVGTPLGPVEITQRSESRDGENLGDILVRILESLLGKRKFRRETVSVGVPSRRVYFSTRPVHAATGDSSAHVLLREALRSPNVPVNDMVVDVIKAEPDSRQVASIAACDKAYLNEILDVFQQLGIQPCRTEPGPCSLLRLATIRHRARRGDKVVLRLFVSDTQVLTVLVANQMPLLWRFTQLPQGEEAAAVLTACRSLWATSKDCGVESPLDAVMIHGRAELKRLVDLDWIEEQLDAPISWFEGPALEQSQIALGLAQGGLERDETGFDLGRSVKPRPKLRQLFPWREAVMQCALLACMGLFLGYTYWTLEEEQQSSQTRAAASATDVKATKRELQKEKKELEGQVLAIREFLGSRVLWTTCLRDVAPIVPKDIYLTTIRGLCPLKNMSKKTRSRAKNKNAFVLRGMIDVPPGKPLPREINRFLFSLQSLPSLEKDFPKITLDELKRTRPSGSDVPVALFTVVCTPDQEKSSKKKKSAAKVADKGAKHTQ